MKAAKRLLAGALSALLALPMSVMGSAIAADDPAPGLQEPNHKVLATVMDRGSANAHASGYQASNNGMKINVKDIDSTISEENLALFINVYIENRDNPDELTLFEDSQGQFQFVSSIDQQEDGSYVYHQVCWNWNKENKFNIKPGWNTLQLNFSTAEKAEGFAADTCNIDLTNINNFRLAFWNFADFAGYDRYRIRIAGAVLVDTRYEPEKPPVYDNTDPIAGTWSSFSEETVYTTTNKYPENTTPLNTGTHTVDGGTIDLTGHNPDNLYLSFDLYAVDKTHPDKIGDYFNSAHFWLYSKDSANNYAMLSIRDTYPSIKPGDWNHFELPLSKTRYADRIDMSQIDRLYLYIDSVNHPSEAGDTFEMKVRNVKIIDTTNDPVEMTLPTLFGSGMIFQQGKPFSVWGTAEAGDTVTAVLTKEGAPVETLSPVNVDENGNWKVTFKALEGGYDSYSIKLTNKGGDGQIRSEKTLTDIVIGEVWVAGGQSNMHLTVNDDVNRNEILEGADNHNIRMYMEPTNPVAEGGPQPLDPLFSIPNAKWGAGDDASAVSSVSSVGYNFVSMMQEKLDMPVGLLNTAVGGSVIEAWISRETVAADDEYRTFLDDNEKYCDEYWWPSQANRQSTLYNAKIGPLEGYNTAGAIWYQGESNRNDIGMYDHALELVQKDWSRVFGFGEEEMPFLYVQLAPHYYGDKTTYSTPSTVLAYTSETMSKAAAAHPESMGQVAIYDLPLVHWHVDGNSGGAIHPNDKIPVAKRLAYIAENMVYGGEGETTAPVYKSMEIKGNKIQVTFDHVDDGLAIGNDSMNLQGFAIAGADGVFVNAQAKIVDNDTVEVWSDKVAAPKNVTYAFTTFNMAGNLASQNGLAVIPFRTSTETEDAKLFRDHDWIYADGEVWVSVNTNETNKQADFHDVWTATDADHSYDTAVKSEGKASLKVAYTGNGTSIAPKLTEYPSLSEQQFANFGGLTVDFKNGDAREKQVKMVLTANGKTYTSADTATLAANSDFTGYDFSLTALTDDKGAAVTDVAAVLEKVTALQFVVTDTAAGTVYLDNIRFAVTLDQPAYTLGDIDGKDGVTAADALMALQAATKKINLTGNELLAADVDSDGEVTASDALLILQFATRKITQFSVK